MNGPRPYYRYPWSPAALSEARTQRRRRPRPTLRQIGNMLKERRLVDQVPDPATLRRALRRRRAVQP